MEIEKLVTLFFEHQTMMKMYHFQTKLYGAHKAADAYLILFGATFDRFMEAAQGDFGILRNKSMKISFRCATDKTIDGELRKFTKILKKDIPKSSEDLLAIRDEMLADVQQLRYLLTFK
jgi:Family of unknown function (DUF5856)